MSKATEQIEALIAQLEKTGADPIRLAALRCTQRFKRSWVELAEMLVQVRNEGAYETWGYDDFHKYCAQELHLRRPTVDKLTGSFGALQRLAPQVLAWDGIQKEVPSYQAVDYFSKAMDRAKTTRAANDSGPAPDRSDMKDLRKAVFDEGAPVGELRKRFDPIFHPKPAGAADLELISKAKSAANRLMEVLPDVPRLSRGCTTAVEKALGSLRAELEDLEAPLKEKVAKARAKARGAAPKAAGKKKAPPRQRASES